MYKSVFLCGFMGCGKSAVGRYIARSLSLEFVDLDDEIVRREGRTIPEIFSQSGEKYFREVESRLVKEYSEKSGFVVATGGGALISDENAAAAKSGARVVYIDASFESCYERIKNDKNRPIAASSTKEELEERYNCRRPVYLRNCDAIASGRGSVSQIAESIIEYIEYAEKAENEKGSEIID